MCLMLYLASELAIPLRAAPEIYVEELALHQAVVRKWFSLPQVRFIGAHTGCSCGFPSVIADEPIEYYDGFFDDAEERAKDLASVGALFDLLDAAGAGSGAVELLAVWVGDEADPPKGVIQVARSELIAEQFFFTEAFLYRITFG